MLRALLRGILTFVGESLESFGTGISRTDLLDQIARLRFELDDVRGRLLRLQELVPGDPFEDGRFCENCGEFSKTVEPHGFGFMCEGCRATVPPDDSIPF